MSITPPDTAQRPDFTKDELLLLCETHTHAHIRRGAGNSLYHMGKADAAREFRELLTKPVIADNGGAL